MSSLAIKRAIISVWDKEGIIPLAQSLVKKGIKIFSTGGTYKKLIEAGMKASTIEDLTKSPEILDGRVKTLHPSVFAGILADGDNPSHKEDLKSISSSEFQLVIVNLYPFAETFHSGEKSTEAIIEMIDIGGPSMLRAAAKNYKGVAVLSAPEQYERFQERLENNKIDVEYRRELASAVFMKTALYDSEISNYFSECDEGKMPALLFGAYKKSNTLRYGENPDQRASVYAPVYSRKWEPFKKLQGKEISYNNYVDCLSAYRIVAGLEGTACVNIKHTNPCGFGIGKTALDAYKRAVKTDPVSYFGGIVGVNCIVDEELAEELTKSFLECIVAPGFTDDALKVLSRKKKLRILIPISSDLESNFDLKSYGKGMLVQDIQNPSDDESSWEVVTERKPDPEQIVAVRLGWHLIKAVKSNAIVLSDSDGAVGIGAGQMSRVDSLKIAIRKAQEAKIHIQNSVMASDAFFPFRDSVELAAEHGVVGVIQPGGSIRDKDVIAACNEHKLFMIFTGKRVFKH